MNPSAIVFWCIGGGAGYLLSGVHGAIFGIVMTMTISFVLDIIL